MLQILAKSIIDRQRNYQRSDSRRHSGNRNSGNDANKCLPPFSAQVAGRNEKFKAHEEVFSRQLSAFSYDYGLYGASSARIPAVKRRTLLQTLPAVALLPASLWAASQQNKADPTSSTAVYELRIYHAAPGKLNDLLARFRDHTIKIFERHGMKSIAYWTPVDEPQKSDTLVYILRHPSREAATANWKSFEDDPEWKKVREKSEANGKLVEKVDSTFLVLTDFSPRLH